MEYKSQERKSTIENFEMIYETEETVIELFDNYTTIVSKAKYEAKRRKRIKILTSKQIL